MSQHWPRDAVLAVKEPWPQRWRSGWRNAARWFRPRRFVGVGALAGAGMAWLVGDDQIQDHLQVADSVARLAVQVASTRPVAPVPTQKEPGPIVAQVQTLPGQQTVTRVWPDLQQSLTSYGLRVAAMRPLPEPETHPSAFPWPSQAVAVRMTGRFVDWQQAWADLSAAGPVWSMERLSVTPQNLSALPRPLTPVAGVQVDAVLRVWLQPGPDGPNAWPMSRATGAAVLAQNRDEVFGLALGHVANVPQDLAAAAGSMSQVSGSLAVLPADPVQWPLARVRLAGLWQQGGQWQAVLAAGPHVVPVRLGQRIAQGGWRIEVVQSASVRLRSAQGALHELHLEGASP